VLGQLKAGERDALVEQIKPLLSQLKKFSYGKQIVAIEKLIFDPASVPNAPVHAASSTTPPNSHKSSPQPSKRPLNSADNCRVPAVGAAPPTPPPTDNPCNAENTADTKCGVRSTVTAVEAEDGTDANARVEITQA
jgi:mRNA-binding protein PUF3